MKLFLFTGVQLQVLIMCSLTLTAQNTFNYSDTIFNIGDKKILSIEYYFNGGGSPLRESLSILDSLSTFLLEHPNTKIEIGVHTDYRGFEESNKKLSFGRARRVAEYLISKGIAPDRITHVGYGEDVPIKVTEEMRRMYPFLEEGALLDKAYIEQFSDDNEKFEIACALNRRTEIKIIGVKQ